MTRKTMSSFLRSLYRSLVRCQLWFDERFGWFFTNGMKEHRAPR